MAAAAMAAAAAAGQQGAQPEESWEAWGKRIAPWAVLWYVLGFQIPSDFPEIMAMHPNIFSEWPASSHPATQPATYPASQGWPPSLAALNESRRHLTAVFV